MQTSRSIYQFTKLMQDHWLIPICHNIKTNYKLANAYGFHEIHRRSFTARSLCSINHFYFIYDQLKFIFRLNRTVYNVHTCTWSSGFLHYSNPKFGKIGNIIDFIDDFRYQIQSQVDLKKTQSQTTYNYSP